jgi:NADH-quinone oxidoreductase subunit G
LRPASEILADLAEALPGADAGRPPGGLWNWLAGDIQGFSPLANLAADPTSAARLLPDASRAAAFSGVPVPEPEEVPPGQVELVLVDQTFGTEELGGYSAPILKVEGEPYLTLHDDLAAALGLVSGDQVVLPLPGGEVTVGLKTAHDLAAGVAILPRHRRLEWQKAPDGPVWLPTASIRKL